MSLGMFEFDVILVIDWLSTFLCFHGVFWEEDGI